MSAVNLCGYVCVSAALLVAAISLIDASYLLLAYYAAVLLPLLAAVNDNAAAFVASIVAVAVAATASASYPKADVLGQVQAHVILVTLVGGGVLIAAEPTAPPSAPGEPPTAAKHPQSPA